MDSAKTPEVPVTCEPCGADLVIRHRDVWRALGQGARELRIGH